MTLCFMAQGCYRPGSAYPKDKHLVGDYFLTTSSPERSFLCKGRMEGRADVVVGPDVQKVRIVDHFIIGLVVRRIDSSSPDLNSSEDEIGWFTLDTYTGNLQKGLAEEPDL